MKLDKRFSTHKFFLFVYEFIQYLIRIFRTLWMYVLEQKITEFINRNNGTGIEFVIGIYVYST